MKMSAELKIVSTAKAAKKLAVKIMAAKRWR